MAKYKTLELHQHTVSTYKLADADYRTVITYVDWDDGEQVNVQFRMAWPVIAAYPIKVRVLVEDLPEATPT